MKMISGIVYAFKDDSSATSSDGRFSFDTDSGTHVVEIHSAFTHRLKKYIKERGHLAAFFVNEQPGVQKIDLLRTRQFGNKIYVDLEIAVKRDISLIDAHSIAERVHEGVEKNFPNVKHVMIHVNPGEE